MWGHAHLTPNAAAAIFYLGHQLGRRVGLAGVALGHVTVGRADDFLFDAVAGKTAVFLHHGFNSFRVVGMGLTNQHQGGGRQHPAQFHGVCPLGLGG